LQELAPSGIRRFLAFAHKPGFVNLGIGEPDFKPPPHVLEAARCALAEGRTHYAPSRGIPQLRDALSVKYRREYTLSYDPESEILVTVGATQAMSLALSALVNPGDEVLIPDPGFVCYKPAVMIAYGTPVSIPLHKRDGFRINVETVRSLITKKSRVVIVNSPSNPTGAVWTYAELRALARLAVEEDLVVLSDEVYEKITYDGVRHYCLAALPGMRERTIVVNSFSKTYAMTGLRVGFAVGPANLVSSMLLVQQFTAACVNGPAQYAAAAALEGSQAFVPEMVGELDRRRRFILRRLDELSGFECVQPKGAFYVFPDITEFRKSSEEFSRFLLKEAKVIVAPGSSFGNYGQGFGRLSYAASHENVAKALDGIEAATNPSAQITRSSQTCSSM
jgi:aminotransferase